MGTTPSTAEHALLLTVDDAAARLAISRRTIYCLLETGELRSVTIGRARRVPVVELHAYVERLVSAPAAR